MFHSVRCAVILLFVFLVPSAALAQVPAAGDTLALDTAIQAALDNNFQAQIARNDVDIAANNRSVGNAGFLPEVTASAGYNGTISDTRQAFLEGDPQDQSGAKTTNRSASAELRWTLFDGLGRFAAYQRLDAELEQARALRQERLEQILFEVIATYYDVARQQQQLDVLREAVAISEERLRIARVRGDVGTASDLEVRQARVDLNADRAAVLRQEVTLATTKATLNRLMARREASTEYSVTATIDINRTLQEAMLLESAQAGNPVLQQARRALRAAELERREIQAERLPTVDATLGYGYSKLEAESGFLRSSESYDFTYGLALSLDVFNGLNRRRRIENTEVRIRNAELTVQDIETQLATEVASAYKNYQNRLQLVELEQENLSAAQENVDIALERFRLGEITSVELREVQEQRIQAESRLLTAQFEAKQAEVTLLQLSGRLQQQVAGAR